MIPIDLSGQRALVTGASGGIGAGIVRRLMDAGAEVVVHYRGDPDGAAALGAAATVRAELDQPGEAARLVDQAWPLDILVHNAADQRLGMLNEATPADWRQVLSSNVEAPAELTRLVASRWMAAGRGGRVVAISSIEARQPAPAHGPYAASKAALEQWVRAAAGEYGAHGIRINSVAPGLIDREGLSQAWPEGVARWLAAAPLGRLGSAEDVANAVVFLVSDLSGWITGASLLVDGGVLAKPTW
ncbi:MAG: SDR family NAD(P)-dependent oxidoreductase [Acidimicrobiales bacterium]